jgi:hypothetical protein
MYFVAAQPFAAFYCVIPAGAALRRRKNLSIST